MFGYKQKLIDDLLASNNRLVSLLAEQTVEINRLAGLKTVLESRVRELEAREAEKMPATKPAKAPREETNPYAGWPKRLLDEVDWERAGLPPPPK